MISFKSSCEIFSFLNRLDSLNLVIFFNSLMIFSLCLLCKYLYISCFMFFNFCLWWYLCTSSTTLACFFLWISLKSTSIMLSREYSSITIPLIVNRWIKSRFFKYLTFLSNLSCEMWGDADLPLFLRMLKYSDFVISIFLSFVSYNHLHKNFYKKIVQLFFLKKSTCKYFFNNWSFFHSIL